MAKENRSLFAVLGMLHYGDMTGYEVRKNLNDMVGQFWQEPTASVYPALRKLEKEGYVTSIRETPERGPARIRYSLTSSGRLAFGTWMEQEPVPMVMRNEFALKLCFGKLTKPEIMLSYIAREAALATNMLKSLDEVDQNLPETDYSQMWRLLLDYGRCQVAASIQWCERASEILKTPSP